MIKLVSNFAQRTALFALLIFQIYVKYARMGLKMFRENVSCAVKIASNA